MKRDKRKRVIERAKKNAEHKKLYSFRLNERLMKKLEGVCEQEGLTVTGMIEALIQEQVGDN